MNLIEKLGLEKCKQIVDGAPMWAESFNVYLVAYGSVGIPCKGDALITDLRTAIADHERTDDCTDIANHHQQSNKSSNFKVGDWVEPVARGSGFRAMELTAVYDNHMEAGHLQLNYGHWKKVDEHTDCTDIKNHISPNTKVIEK